MKKTAKGATKRTSSKEKVARRKASGQVAVEKGRKFEDQVAELYRLLGAEVIQNVEISQKKVDILATFSHPVRHRIIVECKDEKRAVNANQRVMQFQGLLDLARKTGEADSAEIITRVPWGDAAKGFALRSGIMLLTYTEKFAKLLDLRFYLNGLIDKFEQHDPARPSEPPLGVYYVDLSAETRVRNQMKKIPILDSFLMDWLEDRKSRNHLAIFGEYGSGKTSFCQKLSHDLAQSYLRNSNSFRIPILLNLREFVDKLDIEAYITSFLDRECQVPNPKFHVFKAMNDTGLFLLIFDGFDEMAVKVTPETLEANLLEIEKLATSPNAKVLLTSRPEHFTTAREEEEALHPAINTLGRRNAEYEPVRILPWNSEQIELFLQRRVPLIKQAKHPWTYYRDRIRQIRGLSVVYPNSADNSISAETG